MRTLAVLTALLLTAAACADDGDEPEATTDGTAADELVDPPQGGGGTVAVRLEETEGIFVEGFEVGLRFETPDGEVLDQVLWSEYVAALGAESPDASYDSVYDAEVPAGPVVVRGKVTIGIGPGPEPIDPAGDLPCELEVEVPDGGSVEVEVAFTTDATCLRAL